MQLFINKEAKYIKFGHLLGEKEINKLKEKKRKKIRMKMEKKRFPFPMRICGKYKHPLSFSNHTNSLIQQ